MMIYLYIQHTISDYRRWKEAFDIHAADRQAGGATGETYLLRNVNNPNKITILLS